MAFQKFSKMSTFFGKIFAKSGYFCPSGTTGFGVRDPGIENKTGIPGSRDSILILKLISPSTYLDLKVQPKASNNAFFDIAF